MRRQRLKSGEALNRIVRHASRIERNCLGLGLDAFLASETLQDAVGMNLIAIGQWLQDIRIDDPPTFAAITDGDRIVGLRHILAHEYDEIDFSRVWDFIEHHLPLLVRESIQLRDRFLDEFKVQLD